MQHSLNARLSTPLRDYHEEPLSRELGCRGTTLTCPRGVGVVSRHEDTSAPCLYIFFSPCFWTLTPVGPREIVINCHASKKDARRSILIYVRLRVKCKRGVALGISVLGVKLNPGLAQGAQEGLVVRGRDPVGVRICLNDHDISP